MRTESESGFRKTLEKKFLQLFPPFRNVASVEGVSCSGRVLVSCRPCFTSTPRRGEARRGEHFWACRLEEFWQRRSFARTVTATGWLYSTYLKPHHCVFSGWYVLFFCLFFLIRHARRLPTSVGRKSSTSERQVYWSEASLSAKLTVSTS